MAGARWLVGGLLVACAAAVAADGEQEKPAQFVSPGLQEAREPMLEGRASTATYQFDEDLLLGSDLGGANISRFNTAAQAEAGSYNVDVYLNGRFVSSTEVLFSLEESSSHAQPCFTEEFFQRTLGARPKDANAGTGGATARQCQGLQLRLPGSGFELDMARLRLELSIPQALLLSRPEGYVDPQEWDPGETMAFTSYDLSFYRSRQTGLSAAGAEYAYAGFNSGINFGLWRLRQQSNYSYSRFGSQSRSQWTSIRSYAQRALPALRSELTLGEGYTPGNLFSSLGYRGLSLVSDERMLVDSRRQYAPEVKGTASTAARVVVSQNGKKLREISVAPGPFVIDDLYGTAPAGDLLVQVFEADGSISSFVVPFAALPQSIRPGLSHYAFTLGQVRQQVRSNDLFADLSYQRGVSNALSASLGARLAQGYMALQGGGVWSTALGALGMSATYSKADIGAGIYRQGWRWGVNYSRTYQPTNTTMSLASYRNSGEGYFELVDVLGSRRMLNRGRSWDSPTSKQRNQWVLMLNQSLQSYGSLYVSGSVSHFYGGKNRDSQVQMGYSNLWGRVGFSLSLSRQHYVYDNQASFDAYSGPLMAAGRQGGVHNTLTLSLSIPLGSSNSAPGLSASATRNSAEPRSSRLDAGLNGTLGADRAWSYALALSQEGAGRSPSGNGTLQKQAALATFSAGMAVNQSYQALNGGMRGAAVLHQGGLTLGSSVGDSFALIEAQGASGAGVRGTRAGRIDSRGYALLSSLSPYRYNSVGLDPQGLAADAELVETEHKVAPYAGASVRVKFKTLSGNPLLIQASHPSGAPLPLGAYVFSNEGVNVGMVGQGGQIYARAQGEQGSLLIRWGQKPGQSCVLRYDLRGAARTQTVIRLKADCMPQAGASPGEHR
ncbi:fimbria/pilus outer membrane usher protein [Comamonas composti]|uniref:fimbria/pilus outer membrane usher protein n=1 Tax=Comamonas composti TaxID=408558 RepID=UPI00146FB3A7|nr:fimbria/pilus outer membrane usher protein [Comamonas composti]